jgi:3-oxoacyl-[acyl-carrier protein] reductase
MKLINSRVILITGTSRGIGKFLAKYYVEKGFHVVGCSRGCIDFEFNNYQHFSLDITDESDVKKMFYEIDKTYKRLDILINNAGVAATNSALLTPMKTVQNVLNTNVSGTFLFCREAARLMRKHKFGRIINFTSLSTQLHIEGEAIYAASKAAVIVLTKILARELGLFNITVNAIGPNPIPTDIISTIQPDKIKNVINSQAIKRLGKFTDVSNVIDFFINPKSEFITAQVIYLGGI